jgi:hypothetical protein
VWPIRHNQPKKPQIRRDLGCLLTCTFVHGTAPVDFTNVSNVGLDLFNQKGQWRHD